jgi:hypothetical protein
MLFGDAPDLKEEEIRRRGMPADALFGEASRRSFCDV